MNVGEHIRALREARGITLERMAERIGYSVTTLSRWEHGARITLDNAVDIADYFNMTLDCLVMRELYKTKPVTVGERIRVLREEREMTPYELADKMDSYQANVWNWEQGTVLPKLDNLSRMCNAFGITLEEFMKGVEIN